MMNENISDLLRSFCTYKQQRRFILLEDFSYIKQPVRSLLSKIRAGVLITISQSSFFLSCHQ
jgi:hypothetical protein